MKLSSQQLSIIESPRDSSTFLEGPAGTGKSTVGLERLKFLLGCGIPGKKILLFFPQRNLGQVYRDAISGAQGPGLSLPVFATYGGLARRYINLFWPVLEKDIPEFQPGLAPTFLTLESSLYFLSRVIDPLIENQGYFSTVSIQRNRLYSQILDNLNKSAVHSFPHGEIAERLISAWTGDPAQTAVYQQAQEAANLFRQYCYQHNLLDYSLQIELFTKSISELPLVADHVLGQFEHLIYDNCEEDIPVAHDFIKLLYPQLSSALMIYDSEAGYRSFLGASPNSAQSLAQVCDQQAVFTKSFTSTAGLQDLNQLLTWSIEKKPLPADPPHSSLWDSFSLVYQPSYPELVEWLADAIQDLLAKGVAPGQIVILAPFLSDALRFLLQSALASREIEVASHRPSRALRDEPVTHTLLTLSALAHPAWEIYPSQYEISLALAQAIQGLDLTRSHLLAKQALTKAPSSIIRLANFESIPQDYQDRITFLTGGLYQELLDWMISYAQKAPLPLDHFFTHLFGELLSRPGFGFQNDLSKGRITAQIIESVGKFRQTTAPILGLDELQCGKEYYRMVKTGVLANQYLRSWTNPPQDAVFIAPAYTFLLNNRAVEYQFWLDIGSRGWYERIYQPLTNPHILHRDWPQSGTWTDEEEQYQNLASLKCLVTGLIRRCNTHIYGCLTETDEHGYEQKGELLSAYNRILFAYRKPDHPGGLG